MPHTTVLYADSTDFATLDWHIISPVELCTRLSTSLSFGLSSDAAIRKIKEYGPNVPSPPPSRWFRKLIAYFFGGFGLILLTASILVFVAWKPLGRPPAQANLALAIVLAVVFVAQAFFNFYQGIIRKKCIHSAQHLMWHYRLV